MADTRHEKLVEVDLGGYTFKNANVEVDGKLRDLVFSGKVKVSPEVAEDLERRVKEQDQYHRRRLSENGETVDRGEISGNGQ